MRRILTRLREIVRLVATGLGARGVARAAVKDAERAVDAADGMAATGTVATGAGARLCRRLALRVQGMSIAVLRR
jgi:hypothetical protein